MYRSLSRGGETQCRARPDVIMETRADRPSRHSRYFGCAHNYPCAASNSSLMVALPVRDPGLSSSCSSPLTCFRFALAPSLWVKCLCNQGSKAVGTVLSCLAVATRNVSVVSRCEFSDDRADFDWSGKETWIDWETKSLRLCFRGMTSRNNLSHSLNSMDTVQVKTLYNPSYIELHCIVLCRLKAQCVTLQASICMTKHLRWECRAIQI